HRLEYNLRVCRCNLKTIAIIRSCIAAVVAVNSQPVHVAAVDNLLATYNSYVVFYVTCHHTRAATGTGVKVDGHAPVVLVVVVTFPDVHLFRLHSFATGIFTSLTYVRPGRDLRDEFLFIQEGTIIEFLQRSFLDDGLSAHVRIMRLS